MFTKEFLKAIYSLYLVGLQTCVLLFLPGSILWGIFYFTLELFGVPHFTPYIMLFFLPFGLGVYITSAASNLATHRLNKKFSTPVYRSNNDE